jgi:hypothetical protein
MMQGHTGTATSLCLVLLALSLVGWPADAQASMPLTDGEASEENPEALCGEGLTPHPTLVADATLMDDLVNRLNGIIPPTEAADQVHKPLVESARLWGDALDNINLSCQTDDPAAQGLLRLGAVLQLGGSMLNFRIASDNFWRLVIVNGLEAIVGPPPGQ